jgi:hypothetical protein
MVNRLTGQQEIIKVKQKAIISCRDIPVLITTMMTTLVETHISAYQTCESGTLL